MMGGDVSDLWPLQGSSDFLQLPSLYIVFSLLNSGPAGRGLLPVLAQPQNTYHGDQFGPDLFLELESVAILLDSVVSPGK